MTLEFADCSTDRQLARVLALLDKEFVFSRGRPPRLRQRYPHLFSSDNRRNLLCATLGPVLAGTLALRFFDWLWRGKPTRGAMLGMVWTKPELRGRGIARGLLGFARARMTASGAQFGVLWTGRPQIYLRSGWLPGAEERLGEWATDNADGFLPGAVMNPALASRLNVARTIHGSAGVARIAADMLAIPFPATHVEAFVELDGYALVGRQGDRGYVYECVGTSATLARLTPRLAQAFSSIFVNCNAGGDTERLLSHLAPIIWRSHRLAMWLPLAPKRKFPFARWYVDYLDRI